MTLITSEERSRFAALGIKVPTDEQARLFMKITLKVAEAICARAPINLNRLYHLGTVGLGKSLTFDTYILILKKLEAMKRISITSRGVVIWTATKRRK